jgi:hypothetical protein
LCGRKITKKTVSGAVNLKQKTSSASQELKAHTHEGYSLCFFSFEPAAQFYSFQLKADLHSGGQSSTISAKQKARRQEECFTQIGRVRRR